MSAAPPPLVPDGQGQPPTAARPRLSLAALLSVPLGLFPLTGVPAMLLGLHGLRAVNATEGRLRGRRLAITGMVLGAAGTAVLVAGLVLMGVFHLSAVSKRAECANHLREVGMGFNRYAEAHGGELPPGTVPNAALEPGRRLSWMAAVLPYLTEGQPAGKKAPPPKKWQTLAGQLDLKRAWDEPPNAEAAGINVPAFFCPALDRPDPLRQPGLTTYPGLAGVGPDAARLPKTDRRAGVFGYDRVITRQDVTAGISFTMMVAETTRDLGPWVAGGPSTVRSLPPGETHYVGVGRPFGGLHPDGANVLWVDTSVRFVKSSVAPEVFRAQATLAGAEAPDE
jgi:prepilin-type processing-associated H-X9-DG protein